ncbi:MAG: hypothetical protein A2Z91_02390 [Deltaproteobacteria bacterium GWA2_38_16]|nr:MAG: hypothetical protein A2Z91_02390 [Deltaproteobacteria bacterium GWA2_38_16]OGQ02043.1 MAG: hypothetical protein A3D19_08685 [Deltaproteobacteria bacterium RIFCSPHIGHO2_02_FULL_38_15]OGQ33300.1 MAG: hypothetical protein A3A72_07230 [Deltaproteobacteria bacterium RIFCSPLOWO2_01_FULL_38_9]HBQ21579.1 hypothetical protein [Deltaproteobacteria bacterium]
MHRHLTLSFYFLILPLVFSCGSADMLNEGSGNEPQAERGMTQAVSQDFITAVETINQNGEITSEFATEQVGIRVRVKNTSSEPKTLLFNDGRRARVEILQDHSLVWSNDDMMSIQVISEESLGPDQEMSVVIPWNQLTLEGRVAGRGIYRVRVSEVRARPTVPVPPMLEFEVR